MTNFTVTLAAFEGPLDLMLHLIKEKKLDLFDLNVDTLTEQYIAFLDAVENKLDIASEYLSELASLIEYKSKKCLPQEPNPLDVDEFQEDPKEALIRRLLEYQRFKEVSQILNDRYVMRQLQIAKPIEKTVLEQSPEDNLLHIHADQGDLIKAMQKCLQRFTITHPNEVRINKVEISIEYRTEQLMTSIANLREPFTFEDMTQDCEDVHMLIVTFLSILEMARQETLVFWVKKNEIRFKRGSKYGFNA